MKKRTFKIAIPAGDGEGEGYELTPNFWARQSWDGEWVITHTSTGQNMNKLGTGRTLTECRELAKRLERILDWKSVTVVGGVVEPRGKLLLALPKIYKAAKQHLTYNTAPAQSPLPNPPKGS